MVIVDVVAAGTVSVITIATRRHRLMERIRSSPAREGKSATSLNDERPIRKVIVAYFSQPDRDPLARTSARRGVMPACTRPAFPLYSARARDSFADNSFHRRDSSDKHAVGIIVARYGKFSM